MATNTQEDWLKAKAHFVLKNSSLSKWCREQDTDLNSLKKAFDNKWEGPKARELVQKLKAEVGIAA